MFRKSAENSFSDWHHPTRRQYLIVLEGRMEVTCGDGSSRQFQPGDVLLAEDMTGQGHQTRAIGGSYRSVSMGIPDRWCQIIALMGGPGYGGFPRPGRPQEGGPALRLLPGRGNPCGCPRYSSFQSGWCTGTLAVAVERNSGIEQRHPEVKSLQW